MRCFAYSLNSIVIPLSSSFKTQLNVINIIRTMSCNITVCACPILAHHVLRALSVLASFLTVFSSSFFLSHSHFRSMSVLFKQIGRKCTLLHVCYCTQYSNMFPSITYKVWMGYCFIEWSYKSVVVSKRQLEWQEVTWCYVKGQLLSFG